MLNNRLQIVSVMTFEKLYENVLELDPKIRFATIFNTKGKIIQSGHREGVTSLLDKKESKKSINEILHSHEIHHKLAKKYGKEKYTIGVYDKIVRIIVPLDKNHILYVTCDNDIDHFIIIKELTKLIQK